MLTEIVLGQRYKDAVTGFEGIATAKVQYLFACEQVRLVADATDDGTIPDGWFDIPSLVPVQGRSYAAPLRAVEDRTGGPGVHPPARHP